MTTLLVIIHIVVCVALIMIVLLQTGKGADMGAAFGGGGSQTLFGATGASTFLSKLTTVAAIIFMLTSLVLAYKAGNRTSASMMSDQPVQEQPAAPAGEPQAQPTQSQSTNDASGPASAPAGQPDTTTNP